MSSIMRVDDRSPAVVYDADWDFAGLLGEYEETTAHANKVNARARFSFVGTSVSVYGTVLGNARAPSDFAFLVDSDLSTAARAQPHNTSPERLYSHLLYQSPRLDNGTHVLVVTNMEGQALDIWIDFFEVEGRALLPGDAETIVSSPALVDTTSLSTNTPVGMTITLSDILAPSQFAPEPTLSVPSDSRIPGSSNSSATEPLEDSSARTPARTGWIIAGVLGGLALLVLLLSMGWWWRRRRALGDSTGAGGGGGGGPSKAQQRKRLVLQGVVEEREKARKRATTGTMFELGLPGIMPKGALKAAPPAVPSWMRKIEVWRARRDTDAAPPTSRSGCGSTTNLSIFDEEEKKFRGIA